MNESYGLLNNSFPLMLSSPLNLLHLYGFLK